MCLLLAHAPTAALVDGSGNSLGALIGGDRFYGAGYNGQGVVVTNIDGGHAWGLHDSLSGLTHYFDARALYQSYGQAASIGQLGSFDQHATWMAHAIAGRGATELQRGLAYGAELWSGAVANAFTQGTTNFTWNRGYAYTAPYADALLTGRNGRTADVINSSWGWSDPAGANAATYALDGMARASGAVTVFAAGNNGGNTAAFWGSPGGYNGLVVGALAAGPGGYNTVAGFSGQGPAAYTDAFGNTVPNARARVDLVAPGQAITLARYGGTTGSNASGTDPTGGSTSQYTSGVQGTSVASAVVAGGASLLVDMAYDRFTGNEHARDGQVIKAVLLNSAQKITGWSNAQTLDGQGVLRTTRALDYASGAGALDLRTAFDQFGGGTTDLSGLGGGLVQRIGWDYGAISQGAATTYTLSGSLAAGSMLNATLNWFVGRRYDGTLSSGGILAYDDFFTDLALQVWRLDGPGGSRMVAESNAAYINTEHLSFALAETGTYQLRVAWMGERYDLIGNSSQSFGLAWSVAEIPEPRTAALWAAGGLLVVFVARRRSRRVGVSNSLG